MTKTQKNKQKVREQFGRVFKEDRFGHYKHGNYRVKMGKILFRFETKVSGQWMRLLSVNYNEATEGKIEDLIKHMRR